MVIKEIVRKSNVNWEINLPIIAVVGSQSTGYHFEIKEKVLCFKASLEKNFYQKEKVLLHEDQYKFSFLKFQGTNNMQSLCKKKDSFMKIWKNSKK